MYGMTDRPTDRPTDRRRGRPTDRPPTRRGPTDFGRQRASLPLSLRLFSFLPSCLRYLPYLVELLINAGADDDGSELTAAATAARPAGIFHFPPKVSWPRALFSFPPSIAVPHPPTMPTGLILGLRGAPNSTSTEKHDCLKLAQRPGTVLYCFPQ